MEKLNDIAGYELEKKELRKVIDVLNNREKYASRGSYIPKGLILYGEPGNGKTLFAKVLASETNVNFYEFDTTKMFAQSRFKKLYKKASKNGPSIIFIDEISRFVPDSEYESDTLRSNLTMLLSLIDGMDSKNNVFLVGTANDYGSIPQALVRPGRIDMKIFISYPDLNSRKEILNYYINKCNYKFQTSLDRMALLTNSFSSSGLKTLINQCLIETDKEEIDDKLFLNVANKIIKESIDVGVSKIDKKIIAYAEVGKFIVARTLNKGNYILNIDNGGSSTGSIFFSDILDDDDDYEEEVTKKIFSFKDMLNSIAINYGYYLGNVLFNNGPYMLNENSIDNAEEIINEMLKNGMLGYDNHMYYDDDYTNHVYSQKKLEEIELIKSQIRNKQYELAKNILLEKKEIFKILVPKLMTETMLDSGVVEELIYEYFKN